MHPPRPLSRVNRSNRAFTLIELSIVLVVIGLLVGGVLTGQSLIHAADLRNQIKQLQDYQIAVATFQGKFDCIPGDCINAQTFFGTTDALGNAVNNGNGNGQIDTNTGTYYDSGASTWSASTEIWGAFQQLSMAKMMDFSPRSPTSYAPGNSFPAVKMSPNSGVFLGASYNFYTTPSSRNPPISAYQTGSNALFFVACSNANSNAIGLWDDNCAIFTASDLQSIDQKIDDGKPLSGKLVGTGGYSTNNDCLNISGAASTYKTSNATQQCQAVYVIN